MTNVDSQSHDESQSQKIQSLRDMISNAEKTIQGAKAMLLQIEGKKKAGRKRKVEDLEDGSSVIQGTFDGQIMIGSDGKQYPVPANYASKSKLIEGDLLKLTITADGSFIYKQIGPVVRRHIIGIVSIDERGNHYVVSDGKPYQLLLASVTYFKAEPGDEAVVVVPRDIDSKWGAIENILQKAKVGREEAYTSGITKTTPPIVSSTDDTSEPITKSPSEIIREMEGNSASDSGNENQDITTNYEYATPTKDDQKKQADDNEDALEKWQKELEAIEAEMQKESLSVPTSATETPKSIKDDEIDKKAEISQDTSDASGATAISASPNSQDDDLLKEWQADLDAIEAEISNDQKQKNSIPSL